MLFVIFIILEMFSVHVVSVVLSASLPDHYQYLKARI